jgi:GTP-binding protein
MAGTDGRDPRDDYRHLLKELKLYSPALLDKPRIVGANKMDVPASAANLAKFRKKYAVPVLKISCLTGAGLDALQKKLWTQITALRRRERA